MKQTKSIRQEIILLLGALMPKKSLMTQESKMNSYWLISTFFMMYNKKINQKEKQEFKRKKEEERKKASQSSSFTIDMSTPNFWNQEAIEASTSENQKTSTKSFYKPPIKEQFQDKPRKSKSEIVTLENVAAKFPSFILLSIQKANFIREIPKHPRIEEKLFATNTSGYILDLDKSTNPGESIRIWIGALYQMHVTTKLDNVSILVLAEKRMAGIVYDWWRGPPEAER